MSSSRFDFGQTLKILNLSLYWFFEWFRFENHVTDIEHYKGCHYQ